MPEMTVPRTGTPIVIDSCNDELQNYITFGYCLINMKSKVPARVLNVRDEKVCLVKGMHIRKVPEATDEIHVLANSEPEGEKAAQKSIFGSSENRME